MSKSVCRPRSSLLSSCLGLGVFLGSPVACERGEVVEATPGQERVVAAAQASALEAEAKAPMVVAAAEPGTAAAEHSPDEGEAEIVCVRERCTVPRSLIRRVLAHPETVPGVPLLKLDPDAPTGGVVTVRTVTPGSIGARLALQTGDELVSVAGHPVTSFDDMMAVYPTVEKAEEVAVVLRREGQLRTQYYTPVG
ncbi:MAG: hypothetical protein AAF799_25175 [Myxococcota bacterium]